MDDEVTHPDTLKQEVFERCVKGFRTEVVGGEVVDIDEDGVARQCDLMEDHEFHWTTKKFCKKKRSDVAGKPTYAEIFEEQLEYIEELRTRYGCGQVVLVWHNGFVADQKWERNMWRRFMRGTANLVYGPHVVWGWDTLRSIKDPACRSRFRVDKKKNGGMAEAGNKTHKINDLGEAVTGQKMQNHHEAEADVNMLIKVACAEGVWETRYTAKRNTTGERGMYRLADRDEQIDMLWDAAWEDAHHALRPPWKENPTSGAGSGPPTKPKGVGERPAWGPKSWVNTRPDRLAECFDWLYPQDFLDKLADLANKRARQIVRPVPPNPPKGKTPYYVGCHQNHDHARPRFSPLKAGETIGAALKRWNPLTADHIAMVLAMRIRMGAKGDRSQLKSWVCMYDEGACCDDP
ncbi:MAG: hypothetical protein QF391_10615, partial [Myxococcota bacterium]|nr:hypothetical protein [Myxococcota bacterium]